MNRGSDRRPQVFHLDQMTKGWFVGSFQPRALQSDQCEVGIKRYRAGDCEELHYHKVATEVTVIVSGKVRMLDQTYGEGQIIVLPPFVATTFEALQDSVTAVVKVPAALNDKYLGAPASGEPGK